jgi:signal transduction histidine kinase
VRILRLLRWSALSLRTKGLIVVALPVLPLAIFWSLTAWTLWHRGGPDSTAGTRVASQAAVARVFTALLDADAGARDYLLTDNATARQRYEDAVGRLPEELEFLDTTLDDGEMRAWFDELQETITGELAVLRRVTDGQAPDEPLMREREALDRSAENLDRARELTIAIQDRQAVLAITALYRGELTNTVLLWSLLIGSVVCGTGGIAVAVLVAGSVSRRVRILARNADRLARGDALHTPPLGDDEIGQLDRRFREAALLLRAREEELQRRTAQLETANRELEAFSYSVSHDLRAPLRAIDGFSEILEEHCGRRLNATGRDALGRVRAGAQRMATLIEALIDLARLTRAELRRQPVDLSAASREILDELGRQHPARAVDVEVAPDLTAEADPHLLRTALQNLLDNALKYTAHTPHARIEVGSTPNGHARVFHVRDNGVGFNMQQAGRLFSPFQRLHSDREFPGTGIGLAIVHRVVQRHGGHIWAESTAGGGAAFFFTLEPEEPVENRDA